MTNELPEVGSRWTIDGASVTVKEVRKKGRGYYVAVESMDANGSPVGGRERLQDFRKKAKAAE